MTLDVPLQPHQLVATVLPLPRRGLGLGGVPCEPQQGPRQALTPPVGDVAADAHLPNELGEQAVLLVRPLLALQGLVVLLVLLQALEGAAVGLPEAPEQSRVGVTGMHPSQSSELAAPTRPRGDSRGPEARRPRSIQSVRSQTHSAS